MDSSTLNLNKEYTRDKKPVKSEYKPRAKRGSRLNQAVAALFSLPNAEKRVSRVTPCPVCGKPDWCLYNESIGVAICSREPSETKIGNSGWLHVINEDLAGSVYVAPTSSTNNDLARGNSELLHAVYTALLGELTLSEAHREVLKRRGLSDEAIDFNLYRSLTASSKGKAVKKLLSMVKAGELARITKVPGFYGSDKGEALLSGAAGLLIPVRNVNGLIEGISIRSDDTEAKNKYTWLSSTGKRWGCGSGAPVNVAMPDELKTADICFITEGALKADIAASYLGCVVIGAPGVSNTRRIAEALVKLMPRRVVVAFDNDQRTNEQVHYYTVELHKELVRHKLNVYEAVWSSKYNGIDDYLASGSGKVMLRRVAELRPNGSYELFTVALKSADYQANGSPKKLKKEYHANGYNYAQKPLNEPWRDFDELRPLAPHIIAPEHLNPFSFPECVCPYCARVNSWHQQSLALAYLENP